ncbi:dTDP-4-dehydrorhamnose 3,5-epimerase [Micromonospora sp. NPDC049559]|uniref:dTDP-4-dehydrorhamnose 3,5-epimerase family protein n=1 Tax=Micromonospora sp. NPDC049559 TaxID=3155923 RepID=UPI00343B43A5
MEIKQLKVADAYLIRPRIFPDSRGAFLESFSQPAFQDTVGYPLVVNQVNCSISRKGTVRGLHSTVLPPGQARYITCVQGAIVDIVVDLRIGSPTFGEHVPVRLDGESRHALYLAEGLSHGFSPISAEATVIYLCSSTYDPPGEIRVHPLDPELALPWPDRHDVILSEKDRTAPSLQEALRLGTLPSYVECREFVDRLRAGDPLQGRNPAAAPLNLAQPGGYR